MEEIDKILSTEEIQQKMRDLPYWALADNKIARELEFKDFMNALGFIIRLAAFFEKNDHHPDIHISYKKITFELTTSKAGSRLTKKDFITALKIEEEFTSIS